MRDLGFRRFSRVVMRFPASAPSPSPERPVVGELRAVREPDLAEISRLHGDVYRHHLDRFLYFRDPDPVRDAELQIRDIGAGRWGPLLLWASWWVDLDRRAVAVALVVRAPEGPLLVDVAVDPAWQGRRLGRVVTGAAVRALRERGEGSLVLHVTEGNSRAIRLYRGLGFVPDEPSTHGWYSPAQIPVDLEDP